MKGLREAEHDHSQGGPQAGSDSQGGPQAGTDSQGGPQAGTDSRGGGGGGHRPVLTARGAQAGTDCLSPTTDRRCSQSDAEGHEVPQRRQQSE